MAELPPSRGEGGAVGAAVDRCVALVGGRGMFCAIFVCIFLPSSRDSRLNRLPRMNSASSIGALGTCNFKGVV